MDAADRHRLATMIDIALRDSTDENERAAAVSRIREKAGGKGIAEIVQDILTSEEQPTVTRRPQPVSEHHRTWNEWKQHHEETVAECVRLRRRLAVFEAGRLEHTRVRPDDDGYISYPQFLIALLAAREWQVRDALFEFAKLAEADVMDVNHWRERGKAPYYFYQMLDKLPFKAAKEAKDRKRKDIFRWTDEAVEALRGYFATNPVPPDSEIAREMTERFAYISQRSIHSKAHKLGLLNNVVRAGRHLKAPRNHPAAAGSPEHSSH